VRVVIDHVAGSRRGQRQEFPAESRVRFGRHPECEVSFDPHRDIDASSRHAELRPRAPRVIDPPAGDAPSRAGEGAPDPGWVLVDLGSSNGTYVEGHRITESPVAPNTAVSIEFGPGGPRVRLFVGDDAAIEGLPPAPVESTRPRWLYPAIGGAIALVVIVVLLLRC
jgi:pSer/pThr/pTyr-binding forkhead associated (FHA) protein